MVIHVGKAWRGRLVNWVEKSSFEKIRRLLEVSERERHCKVLLTPENISSVRHNPTPYNLPVIPRPLPPDVVEGEHFVVVDLRRLVSRAPAPPGTRRLRHRVWCKVLAARPGHLLPRVGVPVRPSPFSVGELGVVILRGSVCLCKWLDPPLK